MTLQHAPIARTHMLIRRPVDVVYESFIDPAITSKFWFTRGSGKLQPGGKVTWYWDMYGVSADVTVKLLEPNRRIAIEWPTPVEWELVPRGSDTTFVTITAYGFAGTDDEQVKQAIDSMGGFSFLLASCKAYLEHGIVLTLVADHDPDAYVK